MEDLRKLQEWASKWQMVFKPEKCFVMNITLKHNPSLYTYSMRNTPLAVVKSWTYLGAVIDSKLNFNEHCEKNQKKSPFFLGHYPTITPCCPKRLQNRCVPVPCQTKTRICLDSLESTYQKKNIDKLEKVQNKAARFVTKSYDYNWNKTWVGLILRPGGRCVTVPCGTRSTTTMYSWHFLLKLSSNHV